MIGGRTVETRGPSGLDQKRERIFLKRREFLFGAAVGTIALALPKWAEGAARWAFFLTPVVAFAQVGSLFPSLRLLKRLAASGSRNRQYVLSHAGKPVVVGRSQIQTIDIAFVFPGVRGAKDPGNLGDKERRFLLEQIPRVLEKDFGYRVVRFQLDPGPSFWYPYLSRRVLCCRLAVTLEDKVPCVS